MAQHAPWLCRVPMACSGSHRRSFLCVNALALLATTALWLSPAYSQSQVPLRGALTEREVLSDLDQAEATRKARQNAEQATPNTFGSEDEQAVEQDQPPASASTLFTEDNSETDVFGERPVSGARSTSTSRRTTTQRRTTTRVRAEEAAAVNAVVAVEAVGSIPEADEERNERIERENQRAEAIEKQDKRAEENPYSPLGMRLGTFNVFTTLEQGLTATDNAAYSSTPESAVLSESTLRLNAISDWSRHQATVNAYGTYRRSVSGEKVDDPSAGIDGALTLDINHDLRGFANLGYNIRREAASSPVLLPPNVERPLRHQLTGSAGLRKEVGKLRLQATGSVERLSYSDANISGGGTLSQEERNSTLVSGALRLGYEVSPAITPFVEVQAGRRIHDMRYDTAGYARSSNQLLARAGVELDLREKLTGEIAAGWISENFDDNRLQDASGLSTNARLTWSPERGTNVNLNASTTVEGTTTAGESGSMLHSASIGVDRQIRSNLTASALLGFGYRDYIGLPARDLTMSAETSLTWWLNRYVGLKGRYRYEQVESTLPNRDSQVNSVFVGLTLQK